jgi:hypothetical protein
LFESQVTETKVRPSLAPFSREKMVWKNAVSSSELLKPTKPTISEPKSPSASVYERIERKISESITTKTKMKVYKKKETELGSESSLRRSREVSEESVSEKQVSIGRDGLTETSEKCSKRIKVKKTVLQAEGSSRVKEETERRTKVVEKDITAETSPSVSLLEVEPDQSSLELTSTTTTIILEESSFSPEEKAPNPRIESLKRESGRSSVSSTGSSSDGSSCECEEESAGSITPKSSTKGKYSHPKVGKGLNFKGEK